MKEILSYLANGSTLTQQQAKDVLLAIGHGKHSEAEIASFLTMYIVRNIQPEELAGFREAMLELCVSADLSDFHTIDVCGTGGDTKNTFNVSTVTAFVLAGAGAKVVKHGNYAVSSASGSSNMLEFLGYEFSNDISKLKNELERANICYLHAPLFHPAMKYVAPVRKALKLPTFFNILGPMINPAQPSSQLIGVFNTSVLELYKNVYKTLGMNYAIVHSSDGYDEISLTSPFRLANNQGDTEIKPSDMGFDIVNQEDIIGGTTVDESAKIFHLILTGKGSLAQQNVVIANAAVALTCYYPKKSLEECTEIARESLLGGKAYQVVKKLVQN